jgi:hypothetical protein
MGADYDDVGGKEGLKRVVADGDVVSQCRRFGCGALVGSQMTASQVTDRVGREVKPFDFEARMSLQFGCYDRLRDLPAD